MGISQWAPTGSFADVPMIVSWGFYLLVFPCIAYVTMIALADVECIAENLEAAGRAVPGYRPGRNTAAYLNHVVRRLAFAAVVFLTILCLLPDLMLAAFDAPLYFGSTGLLILILVIIMLVQSIHAATRPGGGPSNVFDGAMAKQPGLTDWQEHEDGLGDLFPDRPGKQDVASGN